MLGRNAIVDHTQTVHQFITKLRRERPWDKKKKSVVLEQNELVRRLLMEKESMKQ